MLVDVTDGSSTLANERTHLAFLSHGVGACGRRPSESADPVVGRAGRCSDDRYTFLSPMNAMFALLNM